MKNKVYIVIGIILLIVLSKACTDEGDVGASMDWGDGYYWNSQSHQVEETIW